MSTRYIKLWVVALATVLFSSQMVGASSITLVFNGGVGPASPVTNQGFQIASPSGFTANGFPGSPLFVSSAGGLATLTQIGGGPFDFNSILIVEGNPAYNITFTGNLDGGGTVAQTFTGSAGSGITLTMPSTFQDLTSVTWNQGVAPATAYAFNDVTVSPVPLPSSAWGGIALFGVLGLATVIRRRSSAAA